MLGGGGPAETPVNQVGRIASGTLYPTGDKEKYNDGKSADESIDMPHAHGEDVRRPRRAVSCDDLYYVRSELWLYARGVSRVRTSCTGPLAGSAL